MTQSERKATRPEDIWRRWRAPGRATSWAVIEHEGGPFWTLRNPDLVLEGLPEAEMTFSTDFLPDGVLPLEVGQVLPATARRLNGPFGGWHLIWSPYRFEP